MSFQRSAMIPIQGRPIFWKQAALQTPAGPQSHEDSNPKGFKPATRNLKTLNSTPINPQPFWKSSISQGSTWRFMGSYKWGYKSPNRSYNSNQLPYLKLHLQLPMNLQVDPKPYTLIESPKKIPLQGYPCKPQARSSSRGGCQRLGP